MARKSITPEERQRQQRAREIKKAKNLKAEQQSKGDDVCAICDDGGNVTCCDGGCQRAFHLGDEEIEDAKCRLKLGVTKELAKMINEKKEKFICKNCKYKQHQCYVCGLLGSSDLSSEPKVFQCEQDDCGRFYHPECVAKLLYPDYDEAALFEVEVCAGQKFTCPMHECIGCRGGENKDDKNLKFAVCRRCPTVYHRGCLPRDIFFEDGCPAGVMPRAWLLPEDDPKRVLFYCKKHEIVEKLRTPKRNHIIFPDAKKVRVPIMLTGPPMEQDEPEEEELLEEEPIEQDKPEEEEVLDQQHVEQDEPEEEELLDQQSIPKPSESQCTCSGHSDSFAPKALFMHPYPGSCGWIDD